MSQLAARFRQGIKVVLARASRLDETAVTKQCEVVANGRLALSSQIGAELGHISLFLTQEHQELAGESDRRPALTIPRRDGSRPSVAQARALADFAVLAEPIDFVVVAAIWFLKRKSCLGFGQIGVRVPTSMRHSRVATAYDRFIPTSRQPRLVRTFN